MDRRDFLQRLSLIPVGACAALPLAGCAGVAYVTPAEVGGRLLVPISSLEGGGVFVTVPGSDRPVYLHRAADGELVALLARCTHRGCQPEPVADRMVCPCHGSEYDLAGNVLQGPAERPLARYEVTTEGENAAIRVGGSAG